MIALAGRSAVVTGATGALGSVVVRRMLEAGAHVTAAVRDGAKGDALRAALDDPRLAVVVADPGDRAGMDRLVDELLRRWGRLDILANLAGRYAGGAATDLAVAETLWRQNVVPAITATAACLVPMRARGYGRVISVAAQSALRGTANGAPYAMAKGALIRWTESLAAEVKSDGVTANSILPTTIDTPANRAAFPKADPRKWATPDEVASAILFLASEEAGGVTGASVSVPGRS